MTHDFDVFEELSKLTDKVSSLKTEWDEADAALCKARESGTVMEIFDAMQKFEDARFNTLWEMQLSESRTQKRIVDVLTVITEYCQTHLGFNPVDKSKLN